MLYTILLIGRLRTIWYKIRFHIQLNKRKLQIPQTTKILGSVHLYLRNGGIIKMGNRVTLRSIKEGYHGGIPFETTLYANGPEAYLEIGDNCRINGAYIHCRKKSKSVKIA